MVSCGSTTAGKLYQTDLANATSLAADANGVLITGSGGGGGITTLNGDSGSATGSTVTLNANSNCGKSVLFSGTSATISLKVADANSNIFIGPGSGNTVGAGSSDNITLGAGNLPSATVTIASSNVAIGNGVLAIATSANQNVAIGSGALGAAVTSVGIVAIGTGALSSVNGDFGLGSNIVAIGSGAGTSTTTGHDSIFIGSFSGINLAGSDTNNILIGSGGVSGDTNTLRIEGPDQSTPLGSTFIQGISGITITGAAVLVSAGDQLGVAVSSARYKENIKGIGSTEFIYDLRPVEFNYIKDDTKSLQTGLIAEEVEKVAPSLVVYDKEGLPQSVKYHELPTLLLAELKKLKQEIESLKALIK